MSGILMGWVYYYQFSKPQQDLLLALADHGKEDGTHIHPGIDTLMWKLKHDRRHIQRTLRELEEMQVLVPVAYANGGKGKATEYEMHLEAAPLKATPPPGDRMKRIWEMLKGGVQTALSDEEITNSGSHTALSQNDAKGRTFKHPKGGLLNTKGGLLNTKGGVQTAPTNRTIYNHQDNHARAHARETLDEKKEKDAEAEAEVRRPMGYYDFQLAYRKQQGYTSSQVKGSRLMIAYREYCATFDEDSREEASSD